MQSRMRVKNMINHYKKEYRTTGDKDMLLYVAVLKGMYVANGGKQGIPLNSSFDSIVRYSKLVFTYLAKLDMTNVDKGKLRAYEWFSNELIANNKDTIPYADGLDREETAELIADLVSDEGETDGIVNTHKVKGVVLDILGGAAFG